MVTLTTAKALRSYGLESLDEEAKKTQQLYFDDRQWTIRHFAASWEGDTAPEMTTAQNQFWLNRPALKSKSVSVGCLVSSQTDWKGKY